ncbi:MAG: PKD domain-containing protein [Verrucomicrobiaceae bacterium]|nr:PKD domain-containing protein [Verrucomicrobiaceae bacterium]
MDRRIVWLASFFLGLCFAGYFLGRSSRSAGSQGVERKREVQVVQPGMAKGEQLGAAAVHVADPFGSWLVSYRQSNTPEAIERLLAAAEKIADEHREEIQRLILTNPEAAIARAVPMTTRQQLPQRILSRIERRVSGVGRLDVLAVSPDSDPSEPVVRRFATVDGEEFKVHVYGNRGSEMSREETRMHGVAVGRDLAVSESRLRILEIGEIPDRSKEWINVCPISGEKTEVPKSDEAIAEETPAVDDGKQIIYLCDGGHIRVLEEELVAGEGMTGGPQTPTGTAPITRASSTGVKKFLYMRVIFPDARQEPQTEKDAYNNCRQLTDYFQENSYGRLHFMGTVTPTLMLPKTSAWYIQDYNASGSNSPIMNDSKDAARALGYVIEDYQHYVCLYTGGPGSFGGLGNVGGGNTWLRNTSVGTFEHEFGHNVGVWHSNSWNTSGRDVIGQGANVEYGHVLDVMGNSGSGGHFNSSMKEQLQWLTPEVYHTVLSSGTYRMYRFDQVVQDHARRYALRVAKDADRDYWLEFRQVHTTNPWFMSGASINWSPWGVGTGQTNTTNSGSNLGTQLLDMTAGSADDRNDAALVIGRTFSDREAGIHITPIAKGGTSPESLDVVVNLGSFPSNNLPTLSLTADTTTPAAGGTVNLTATASDLDGDPLGYYWDFGDKLASFNGNSFSINNSANQSKIYSAAGYYQVMCTVSDMKGGTVTKSLLITVGTPTTFYVEGTVTAGGNPMANVRISRTTGHLTYTDSDGIYRLTNISTGTSANLSALLGGYSFTAGFTNPTTVSSNQLALDWTADESLPRVTLEIVDADGAETGDAGTMRLNRTGPTTSALVVYTDLQGTATSGDYTLSPLADTTTATPLELFTIPIGQSSVDITLTPVNDTTQEGPEVMSVSLVNGPGYVPQGAQAQAINIEDNDTPRPRVTIAAVDSEAVEDGSGNTAEFVFTRTGSTSADLTVTFTIDTTTGNGISGTDYTAIGSTVVIPTGQSSASVIINPLSDSLVEGMELVRLTVVTNSNHLAGTPNIGTIKILDDDISTVNLTANDATASEGGDPGQFTVTRTGDLSQALIVHYGIAGDATHGVDYAPLSGVVSFAVGASSATIEVLPVNDAIGEPAQTIILQLRSAGNYLVGSSNRGTVTLTDDGDLPTVSVNCTDGLVSEGTSPGTGTFRITTSGTGTGNITVNYTVSGTATSGSDFSALSGTLSIAKNTTASITVTPINDSDLEDPETVTLTLTPSAAYQLDFASSATMAITDDDKPTVVHISPGAASVTEGGSTTFYVSRTGSTTNALTVDYTASGSAESGSDYTAMSGSVTIAAAATGATVSLASTEDTAAEGMEDVVLTVTPSGSYGVGNGQARIMVLDNDSGFTSALAFMTESTTLAESAGSSTVQVTRSGSSAGSCSVEYAITTGTATGVGIDFTLSNGLLTFGDGVVSQSVPLSITEDVLPEEIESFTILLRNPTSASLGTISQHTICILDNEPRVSIRAVDPFAQEGTADTGRCRVTRTGSTGSALQVPLVISGTATNGTDYATIGGSVTIPIGSSSAELVVTPQTQTAIEGLEQVIVTLGASGSFMSRSPSSATVTIMDQETDEAPQVAVLSPREQNLGIPSGAKLWLEGMVADEGSPTLAWSKVSGPGTVSFGTPMNLNTLASFSAGGVYVLRLTANDGTFAGSADVTVTVNPTPAGWTNLSIGSVGTLGAAVSHLGSHTVVGAGSTLSASTSESFFYRYKQLVGDGSITGRVRSTTFSSSSARIGVMLRESTANNARTASMTVAPMTGNASVFHYRPTAAGSATVLSYTGQSPGYWVRMTRVGNSFTAFDSPDGLNWTQRGSPQTIAMGGTVLAGLAVTSAVTTRLNTSVIDNVTITGAVENVGAIVDAGSDQTLLLDQSMEVALSGSSSDDGITAQTSLSWAQASGPGTTTFSSSSSATTLANVSAPGTYVYRLIADDGEIATGDEVTVTLTSPIFDWRALSFGANASNPAIAGDEADPDMDGVVNLLEYALIGNPNSPSGAVTTAGVTATHCSLTYTRPADAADVSYIVEYSEDLDDWESTGVTQTVISTVGNVQTVRAEVPLTLATTKCFMHVKVTRL